MEDLRALAYEAIATSRAVSDPDYPLIHLAPPTGRLNDPNGLVYDGGVWHAFFQLTPLPGAHGQGLRKLVYWGHATSTDLLHWTHHAPAIIPDSPYDASGAYSGSGLVLRPTGAGQPTRSAQSAAHADAAAALAGARYAFFYTGNLKDAAGRRTASQCLVTSPDGRTFDKWPANPLLSTPVAGYTAHFRDPQVTADPRGGYRMLLGVQREDLTGAALVYRSEDLTTWSLEGELAFPDADAAALSRLGYMWECPGLVRLRDEATGQWHDVLIWCPQGADRRAADGGQTDLTDNVFPCVYAVGQLVGTRFHGWDGTVRTLDHGFEFYAPQVFAGLGEQEAPVLIGWAGNAGEDDQPTLGRTGWVHTMTLPRRLRLRDGRLVQQPVLPGPWWGQRGDSGQAGLSRSGLAGAASTPGAAVRRSGATPRPAHAAEDAATVLEPLAGARTWWLQAELVTDGGAGPSGPGELVVRIGQAPACVEVRLQVAADGEAVVTIDRSGALYPAEGAWQGRGDGRVRSAQVPAGTRSALTVIHDRSVTEVVVGDGELVLTLRSFLPESATGASLSATGGRVGEVRCGVVLQAVSGITDAFAPSACGHPGRSVV